VVRSLSSAALVAATTASTAAADNIADGHAGEAQLSGGGGGDGGNVWYAGHQSPGPSITIGGPCRINLVRIMFRNHQESKHAGSITQFC